MKKQIINLLKNYPAFLTSEHLVDQGIYKNIDSAYHARITRHSFEWIKLRHKIIYPKFGIVDFLATRIDKESFCLSSDKKLTTKGN